MEFTTTLGTATADGATATVQVGADLNISATLGTATADGAPATVNRKLEFTTTLGTATADGATANVSNDAFTFTTTEMDEIARRLLTNYPWLVKLKVVLDAL